MESRIPNWIAPAFWGCLVGAIAVVVVEFSTGWVVTSGSAEDMAKRKAEEAVIISLTPICVAKFKQEADRQALLASLKAESTWERGDFVEEHGWATMPGSQQPHDLVAEACAGELLKLAEQA